MNKKVLYSKDYLDMEDDDDQIIRDYMQLQIDDGNGLSKEVQASLGKFVIDQVMKDLEPIEDEVSEECEFFILKCKYVSESHIHNIEIYQTSREVVADFRVTQVDYHDFDELYPLAHKIEFNAYNERLCSVKFVYNLHDGKD